MLQTALILLGVFVGLIIVAAIVINSRPNTFQIHRSHDVGAPAAEVFPLINDLSRWADWSPFEKLDPQVKKAFSDQSAGPGAWYSWSGNNKAGEGKLTIVESKPNTEVKMSLEFTRPFACNNQVQFTLEEGEGGTLVTWKMEGQNSFFNKAFQMFMDMDQMVGKEFEEGLRSLDRLAQNVV